MAARRYLPREIEPLIRKAARQFPVVCVTGPRQTGKSTLLLHLFPRHRYVTLDDPVQRTAARRDPALFIETWVSARSSTKSNTPRSSCRI